MSKAQKGPYAKKSVIEQPGETMCLRCHKPVGNAVFTVCDDCWDICIKEDEEKRAAQDTCHASYSEHPANEFPKNIKIDDARKWYIIIRNQPNGSEKLAACMKGPILEDCCFDQLLAAIIKVRPKVTFDELQALKRVIAEKIQNVLRELC